jgi:hypothetical protein
MGQAAAMGVVVVIFTMVIAIAPVDLQIVLRRRRGSLMTTTVEKGTATTDGRGVEEEAPQVQSVGRRRVARRPRVLLPGVLDGPDAFKQEGDAATSPPTLFFTPGRWISSRQSSTRASVILNSIFATGMSTILVLLLVRLPLHCRLSVARRRTLVLSS